MTSQIEGRPRKIEADTRTLMQAAKLAITDVYDAITELVTNADDRYQTLQVPGKIEIEMERHRGDSRGTLRVRDFADGMTADVMRKKLSRMGERISGLERGTAVRGTNSRGAKDVAALGDVTFESFGGDGKYHKFQISAYLEWTAFDSLIITDELRGRLGIPTGTGTVVTIVLNKEQRIPQHDSLRDYLNRLVPIRDILSDPRREVVLINRTLKTIDRLAAPVVSGTERVNETIAIPGYSGVTAKLTIKRASRPFDRGDARVRLGGILVKSRHAVHESTLFDSSLESDVHAQFFFGKLVCEGIDTLWNEYDERFEHKEDYAANNAKPVIDPSRKTGLTRGHPFVVSLFREVLKRLRPLVEEERRRVEGQTALIENKTTRKRLDDLERAASAFLRDYSAEDDTTTESERKDVTLKLKQRGFGLQPPYAQMITGDSMPFTFSILQEVFPEFELGAAVSVECLSTAIAADPRVYGLEQHPTREGLLRGRFKVTALEATATTGIRIQLGRILAESAIEVLATRADRYADVDSFRFERARYAGTCGMKRKRIRLVAPLALFPGPTAVTLSSDSPKLSVPETVTMVPNSELGVAIAEFTVRLPDAELATRINATAQGAKAVADVRATLEAGAALKIRIEDIDLGNQRYRMRNNVIQIAGRHASLRRYLGSGAEGFPGQNAEHFRVLVAEIVADAVCADIVSRSAEASPETYTNADWDRYYAEYSEHMTKFLPIAHKIVVPDSAK